MAENEPAQQRGRPGLLARLTMGAIRLIFGTACVVLVLLGFWIAASGWAVVRSATLTLSWAPAEGQITRSEAVRRFRGAGSPMVIHYTYQVAGRDYSGSRVYVGDELAPSLSTAQKYVERYPIGKATVYFDPNDPRSAVLERGTSKQTHLTLVFGLGFTLFAAWMLAGFWLFWRPARKKVTRLVVLLLGPISFAPWLWLLVWMYQG